MSRFLRIEHQHWPEYAKHLGHQLMQQRLADEFTDLSVTSKQGGDIYRCHSNILHAHTTLPDFEYTEHKTDSGGVLVKIAADKEMLPLLLDYMYTGDIAIPTARLLETAQTCNYLGMPLLYIECAQEAVKGCNIPPEDVIPWLMEVQLALDPDILPEVLESVKDKCYKIIQRDIFKVTSTSPYLDLGYINLTGFLQCVAKLDINPDIHCEVALKWVKEDVPARRKHVIEILAMDDQLRRLSVAYLEHLLCTHLPLLELQSKKMVEEELDSRERPVDTLVVIGKRYETPRIAKGYTCIVKYKGRDSTIYIDDRINEEARTRHSWLGFSACSVPEGFVLSGCTKPPGNLCWMYNIKNKRWTRLVPLKEARSSHGSIYHKCKLYVIGGNTAEGPSETVHSKSLYGEQWHSEQSLPHATDCNPSVVTVKGVIYVYTGDTLYSFSNTDNVWEAIFYTNCKTHVRKNSDARMTSARDKVCIVGGIDRMFLCYDPATNKWEEKASPKGQYSWAAVYYFGGELKLYGGDRREVREIYDFGTNSWRNEHYSNLYNNMGKVQVLTGM